MAVLLVDGVSFSFADDWHVTKYDEWAFYRKRLCNVPEGRKAVDILAISPDRILHLIEVKDYRNHPRKKPSEIHSEISHKVVDTLAALLPASLNEDFPEERSFAARALGCQSLRIVLHLEQARSGSRIAPRKFKLEDISLKLRQSLRAIDFRPVACDREHLDRVAWHCG